jgi:hypothetical protein
MGSKQVDGNLLNLIAETESWMIRHAEWFRTNSETRPFVDVMRMIRQAEVP